MIIQVDQFGEEPLYVQIRDQIISGIARGELVPGQALPSVRSLASDLGINLHTVNKAYALLRDEGYVLMRGRSGAYIADPCDADRADAAHTAQVRMENELFELALAHRARGGGRGAFIEAAAAQAARAYDVLERPETATTADGAEAGLGTITQTVGAQTAGIVDRVRTSVLGASTASAPHHPAP